VRFEFDSVGIQRTVRKVIRYAQTVIPDFYTLALFDKLETGVLSDSSRTNQGDMEKVLATVLQTVFVFLSKHPDATVVFTGSTPARTRLYQIAISKEIFKVKHLFAIQGFTDGNFEDFEFGKGYEGFAISSKKS
jgi:hypothetical protein